METNGQTTTAIARVSNQQVAAFEPRTMGEAWQMASHFAKSGLLGDLNTPEKVFLVMTTGAELGIPPTTALRMISIVKGKPVIAADLMVAMVLSKRVAEYFEIDTIDEKQCTVRTKRTGRPEQKTTFSMEDAARAKLLNKGEAKGTADESNWAKYPADMLYHRASARLARRVFPDVVGGLYCPEEADEIRDEARVVEEQTIETRGVNELEARVEAIRSAIVAAQNLEDLAAVRAIVAKDPAAKELMARLGADYEAKKAELQAVK